MGIANEIEFENDVCNYLDSHGWFYSADDTGYDRAKALIPQDAIEWIKESQPNTWRNFETFHGSGAEQIFIDRLTKLIATEGTLSVLRNGFKATGAGAGTFQMSQFKPPFGFNADVAAKYKAMRLRVMRQVHYSTKNQNCIDLVLFVNGLPVATIELKTDLTQSIEDAKVQYQVDRNPKDEPLLTFKRGALVHFAVSTEEVWMTTQLKGLETFFLPFNLGDHGRKGNPPNPNGYQTSYFWEQVLDRDNWLRILGSFVQFSSSTSISATGTKVTKESIIFPRYHQMDAVNKLVDTVREEGVGHKYLLQHSAGSGKSNTIGWCAHQLSTLHDAADQKIFDSVIVITDRTVLDDQLKETIKQFQSTPGVVASIDSTSGSKSGALGAALANGAMIIVVTLQTFPFIIAEIAKSLRGKKFAVIIDEAHSSQGGNSARKLRQMLGNDPSAEEAEITVEDVLIAESSQRKLPSNATFIAFTATPKAKTLEIFGRPLDQTRPASDDNLPHPFHLYTMRQAIDEGFILDVLQNYLPYRVAYKLAHKGMEMDSMEVEKSEGMRALSKWVRLHPHNISQRVAVIVEHFKENVAPLLDKKAKAMVVTNSRQEAVRYKLAMDKYIASKQYKNLATLVAFSGEVTDPESGPDKFTESSMNTGLRGRDIRSGFATDDFQVLIVANKFQTGFDQPLLVGMYVDKRLDGITAVQTLSRLNRIHPGKTTTFVLDFVNDVETIRLAFEPYYESTELLATTDPNLIYDLQRTLFDEQIYTEEEANRVAAINKDYYRNTKSRTQKDLLSALSEPVDRFKKRWAQAEQNKDGEEISRLTTFHKNLGSFCRLYDFMAQIINYEDPSLENGYVFYKNLEPLVRPSRIRQAVDLSSIQLTYHRVWSQGKVSISLGAGENIGVYGATAVGTAVPRDPEKVKLEELIQKLNDLFEDGSLTDADKIGLFNHVADKMLENDVLTKQASANSRVQFRQSPTIRQVSDDAIIAAMDNYKSMGKQLFEEKGRMQEFVALLADHVFDRVNGQITLPLP